MTISERWEDARLSFFKARIRHLINDEKWLEALTAVIDLAQWCERRETDSETWLELIITATRIVGHLQEPSEYRAFLAHFGDPFLGDGARPPRRLLDAFASIADHADLDVMIDIGQWLTDARPAWPLGPYLVAHFRELRDATDRQRQSTLEVAERFDLAGQRARRSELEDWEFHCRLRQGALLLTSGADRSRGRELLGDLDWTRLFAVEELWMAVALASSSRWSDRLRAMDIILDLHHAISSARPRYRDLRLDDLRRAASTIFKLAGLYLPEAEDRRLQEISETLFSGPRQKRWNNYLQARRQLSKVAALPIDQVDDVEDLLKKLEAVYPERWTEVAQRFRLLRSGWTGTYRSSRSVPTTRHRSLRLPIADAIAETVSLLKKEETDTEEFTSELRVALSHLNESLELVEPGGDGAAARPVALVWSALFEADVDLQLHSDALITLAELHTAVAPPPSYGWWTLAAHLYNAALPEAAEIIAFSALASRQSGDEATRDFVVQRTFQRAVDTQNAATANRWLQAL